MSNALTDANTSAHALAYQAETLGLDPEDAAGGFLDHTVEEMRVVVALAHRFGLSTESEWAEDFTSAHRHMVERGGATCTHDTTRSIGGGSHECSICGFIVRR
jgi:hypothetical protein